MRFEKEARGLYAAAWHAARREQRQGKRSYPVALKSVLHAKDIAYAIDLEVMNIPTGKIVGVAKVSDKDLAYTADFLPLYPVGSEFARQWCRLYQAYLSDEGLSDPIRCYEYLGNFYVIDGMKRVSVVKSHGAPIIKAQVTRLMPVKVNTPTIQGYYEFLNHFRLTQLYQVSFNTSGNFNKLQKALGYADDHIWTEMDRFSFLFYWYAFDRAFHNVFEEDASVTAADALVAVLEDYPYSEIKKMAPWDLMWVLQRLHDRMRNEAGSANRKAS